ncbi:hypothetical protein [Streptomyces millisiae]|uniref:Integral membrane protein n=1 Tax=Streptomyces millisiae TaxID=3075542 RepID=A0ABU2LYY0_9ACTN|nr:hypothetical protein [Streptomyces sp. DSM 44918]MDT0322793.1 hypothetical protein [Streptomyces sp. DSM 44918]
MIDRHRFEPARLVLGLGLLAVAAVHLERALGDDDFLPLPVLLALPGVVLLTATVVAIATYTVRSTRRGRPEIEEPAGAPPTEEPVSPRR